MDVEDQQEQGVIMCDGFSNEAGMGHSLPMEDKFSTTQHGIHRGEGHQACLHRPRKSGNGSPSHQRR